jgi:hypothetical protein
VKIIHTIVIQEPIRRRIRRGLVKLEKGDTLTVDHHEGGKFYQGDIDEDLADLLLEKEIAWEGRVEDAPTEDAYDR